VISRSKSYKTLRAVGWIVGWKTRVLRASPYRAHSRFEISSSFPPVSRRIRKAQESISN
jgi:hypothetical protein